MDILDFKKIKEAISQTAAAEDYTFGEELVGELSHLVYSHSHAISTKKSFRVSANKKRRNEITGRVSKNANKLSRDMWRILRNQTLNFEILKLYAEVANESSVSKTLRFLMPTILKNADIEKVPLPNIEISDLTDMFRLIIQLTILSEAASRTNKIGLELSTNIETGLPKLSESINEVLKKLKNDDGGEILKMERASIIYEIFSDVGIDGGSCLSISKNIS